jgi:hypothetical protein
MKNTKDSRTINNLNSSDLKHSISMTKFRIKTNLYLSIYKTDTVYNFPL